jgi:ATP-dependent HslUV protease ATP-binding subunit HslU
MRPSEEKLPTFTDAINAPLNEQNQTADSHHNMSETREKFRQMLRDGKLDERQVEVDVSRRLQGPTMEIFAGGNIEDLEATMMNLTNMISGSRSKKKLVSIKEAREIITAEQLDKMIDADKVCDEARRRVEQMGIIFIDEIDKIAGREASGNPDVSREGVQRDILPIVEGTTVMTKYGPVKTDYILFIAAGAFHVSKVSDLIPELQGRFPVRVELEALTQEDFRRILTQPENAIIKQQIALLKVENVDLEFAEDAIDEIAGIAYIMNQTGENIGARRLYTVMEKLMEDISYNTDKLAGQKMVIDREYVRNALQDILKQNDLHRFIL